MIDELDIKRFKLALECAEKSEDPECKVGALIFDKRLHYNLSYEVDDLNPVASGYNALSKAFEYFLDQREHKDFVNVFTIQDKIWNDFDLKNLFVTHAEINCLKGYEFRHSALNNHPSVMYITKPPCQYCAWEISKHQISRLVFPFLEKESKWYDTQKMALKIFEDCEIVCDFIEVKDVVGN